MRAFGVVDCIGVGIVFVCDRKCWNIIWFISYVDYVGEWYVVFIFGN